MVRILWYRLLPWRRRKKAPPMTMASEYTSPYNVHLLPRPSARAGASSRSVKYSTRYDPRRIADSSHAGQRRLWTG